MKLRITILFLIMAIVFSGLIVCDAFAKTSAPINALIVTGQSNQWHDWTKTSPAFKTILEQIELFVVDVATSPAKGEDMSSFTPNFSAYDVVILDYDGDEWPEQTKTDFVDYVKNGGGVVTVHASNNAFPKWKEYNEIIGLGGWGGRNLRSGPMVRYRDGKTILDFTPGNAGHHGPATPYQVINRADNPIVNSLPEKWMHAKDELYCNLRGPAKNLTVVSTAYADPANKGSGENEPILFTINYGKGRVFHDVMGHVRGDFVSSIECVGFITTFQRGVEWAATGEVTQEVPIDFPTADKVMSRKQLKVPTIERMLAEITDYKFGQSLEPMTEIDELIRLYGQDFEMLAYIEQQFISFLNSDVTLGSKEFICEKLSLIGTKASVKMLGKMLLKQDTTDIARLALEQIADPSVDDLLRRSAVRTSGTMQVGIINTIGRRQDPKAVGMLAKMVKSEDAQIQVSSLAALGKIANSQAQGVLEKSIKKLSGSMQLLAYDSYLKCADKIAKTNSAKAFKIYKKIYNSDAPSTTRAAALNGMVLTTNKDADAVIIEALKNDDEKIRSTAAALIAQLNHPEQLIAVADGMSKFSPAVQVQIITALTATGQKDVIKQVYAAVTSNDTQVSVAAIKAIGVLGDESTIGMLVDIAASATGQRKQAARQSLYELKGDNVDQKIVSAIDQAKPAAKIELIKAVSSRKITAGVSTLLKVAKDKDTKISTEALRALKMVAGFDSVKKVINIMIAAKTNAVQKEAQKTIAILALKNPQRQGSSKQVTEAIAIARSSESKTLLIEALGKIGDDDSLELLYELLQSDNEKLKYAALTALSKWPNSKPAVELLQAATASADDKTRAIAIRGFVRVIAKDEAHPADQVADFYQEAFLLAANDGEKKMLLSGLSNVMSKTALEITANFFDDENLLRETLVASVKIAESVVAEDPQLVKYVMEWVIANTADKSIKEMAQGILKKAEALIPAEDEETEQSTDSTSSDVADSASETEVP